MTWSEIKQAVEEAGISEDDEIGSIQCENNSGSGTFQKMRLGRKLNLKESISEQEAHRNSEGCAV